MAGIITLSLNPAVDKTCVVEQGNCEYHDCTVVLNGQVSCFYLKQLAQALVARVTPNSRIRNQLQVVYPECKHPRKPR